MALAVTKLRQFAIAVKRDFSRFAVSRLPGFARLVTSPARGLRHAIGRAREATATGRSLWVSSTHRHAIGRPASAIGRTATTQPDGNRHALGRLRSSGAYALAFISNVAAVILRGSFAHAAVTLGEAYRHAVGRPRFARGGYVTAAAPRAQRAAIAHPADNAAHTAAANPSPRRHALGRSSPNVSTTALQQIKALRGAYATASEAFAHCQAQIANIGLTEEEFLATWSALSTEYQFKDYIYFDAVDYPVLDSANTLGNRAITGFRFRCKVAFDDVTTDTQTLFARRDGGQEFQIRTVSGGTLQALVWSDLGLDSTSVGVVPFAPGEAGWLEIDHDVKSGLVHSRYSSDGLTWTELATGTDITPANVIDLGGALNVFGRRGSTERFKGKVYYFALYDQDERLIQEFNAGKGTYPNYENAEGGAPWFADNGVAGVDNSIISNPRTLSELDTEGRTLAALCGYVSRFYLPSEGEVPITPAVDSTVWTSAGGLGTDFFRAPLGLDRLGTPQVDRISESSRCGGQWISPPLAAQTLSGTVRGQMMGKNHTGSRAWGGVCVIRVIQSDGVTVRGTLFDGSVDPTNMYPMAEGPDPHRNEPLMINETLTSVDCEDGDYLVFEFGVIRGASWGSGEQWDFRTGDDLQEDLPIVAATVRDEVVRNPWIEFSNPIRFL